jgi:geranylgeranyl transferase type-2 subunit alpha
MTELKYTTKKIEANFSNFSAWHQRTKILGKLWKEMEGEQGEKERRKMKEAGMPVSLCCHSKSWVRADCQRPAPEFELVTQALWTDPADQSGWLYHRWLIGDGMLFLFRTCGGISVAN